MVVWNIEILEKVMSAHAIGRKYGRSSQSCASWCTFRFFILLQTFRIRRMVQREIVPCSVFIFCASNVSVIFRIWLAYYISLLIHILFTFFFSLFVFLFVAFVSFWNHFTWVNICSRLSFCVFHWKLVCMDDERIEKKKFTYFPMMVNILFCSTVERRDRARKREGKRGREKDQQKDDMRGCHIKVHMFNKINRHYHYDFMMWLDLEQWKLECTKTTDNANKWQVHSVQLNEICT